MSKIEVLSTQPNFPNEDLDETNAELIGYFLRHEHSDASYADFLRSSLRMLHITGHQALQIVGIEVDYSEKEYNAFCAGFAALEYTSLLVNPRQYDGTLAVANTKELLIDTGELADLEIADRYSAWMTSHPTTHEVITKVGAEHGETMKQLHARGIGAQLACELQRAA